MPEFATTKEDLRALLREPATALEPFEMRCGERWLDGYTEHEIYLAEFGADEEDVKPATRRYLRHERKRRIRWALDRVAERVAITQPLFRAGWEFARAVVDCARNRTQEAGPQELVGLLPTIYLEDYDLSVDDYRRIFAEPKNYRNVAMRSPVAHAGMAKQNGRDSLRHLAAGFG